MSKYWKQCDGTEIKISDMNTDHLQNACNLLMRYAQAQYDDHRANTFLLYQMCNSDAAEDALERQIDTIDNGEITWHDYLPEIFYALEYELKRRNVYSKCPVCEMHGSFSIGLDQCDDCYGSYCE